MIQIQDDVVSQSLPVAAPVAPAARSFAATPTQTPISASAANNPATQSNLDQKEKDNSAEIDRLLAELDKLSKDLEDKPVQAPIAPAAAPYAPAARSFAATPTTTPAATLTQETNGDKSKEKFDFDSFLTDLEKKIDQEAQKNQTTDDFRKNRQGLDVDEAKEEISAATPVISENISEKPEQVEKSNQLETEELRAQNIFEMLGLNNISDEEKNQFLDELESMIWDDFIVHDLELLLTSEEYGQARQILDSNKDEDQKKEELIVYLEKLIPDLDEVLYEKALELKSEMMGERLNKMKEGASEAVLAKVKQAESLISQNLWRQASTLLNS